VRLMVLKQRYRWRYRSLVAEVSDSIHLRRFCRISLSERVPDESTVRKLTRRIGAETVAEMTRRVDRQGDAGEAVSSAGGADRLDGDRGGCEVSDPMRGWHRAGAGVGARGSQAREARQGEKGLVRDRSRAMGHKLRTIRRPSRPRARC
jgi:IS5 family transposase